MTTPLIEHFRDLLADRAGPCVSIYMPTARRFPETQQDVVRFRNLLRTAENSLGNLLDEQALTALLEPLHELAVNDRFWTHTLDGLAVLRAADLYKVYKLQRTVPERAIVADSFHTKPLLRIMQSADRFELLALTREQVKLYHGNRDSLDEIELNPGVPRTLQDALGHELTEAYSGAATVGKAGRDPSHGNVSFGIGNRKDELDKDTERFFRVIDRAIMDYHSKRSGLPLVLAALPEHHATFREISHNPHLLAESIAGNPEAASLDELREKAWQVVQPRYLARLQGFMDEYGAALPRDHASADLNNVAMAALGGRVRTLLVDDDRVVPGRVDRETGQMTLGDADDAEKDPHMDDVLDDLAELTLRMGGDVVMVPHDRMPSNTGVAAIYRF